MWHIKHINIYKAALGLRLAVWQENLEQQKKQWTVGRGKYSFYLGNS